MTNVNFKTKPQYTKERKNSTFATKLQIYFVHKLLTGWMAVSISS